MKQYLLGIFLLIFSLSTSQNIVVDSQTYTPQQLIEDILTGSDCITEVVVTNVVGGDFSGTDQSYGFFDASGTSFPFQSGVVLSTGRLANVPGPNTTLSDDDASNWNGDNDLEVILNETNTHNATIIEFDFVSIANQISFRYLFASEEYQEGNPNTCNFSDLFGFLIRPATSSQYENIALVPDTNTPVKVTTVHSGIPGSCDPINETYFGSWNSSAAPINFNGQTTVLTATAQVVPNETYHVKLVIADEQNFRFDSAVFLEAGSFELNTNLGPNRLIATNNPLCENETLLLNATQPNATSYRWFRDDIEIVGETNSTLLVDQEGKYNVQVSLVGNCISFGEVDIEYTTNPVAINTTIIECDINLNGLTLYNLFDAEETITNGDTSIFIDNFFYNHDDATNNVNEINTPTKFENTSVLQTVYARVENTFGCYSIAEITLDTSNNLVSIPPYEQCDDEIVDGFTTFSIDDILTHVSPFAPPNTTISFYLNDIDALNGDNALSETHNNQTQNSETIYVKIEGDNFCYSLSTMTINVLFRPTLLEDETLYYCLNSFPQTITLDAGIVNDNPSNYSYQWELNSNLLPESTASININIPGDYTVTAIYPNNCSSSRNISVLASNIATINDIEITQATSNNTITVNVSGEGNYEYSLEHGPYQDSNTFTNVFPGFQTVYVRDKNGCGIVEQLVAVLGFPKFFTPNGDAFHNTWKPFGANAQFNNNLDIKIFDRYGKFIKQITSSGNGWDGTFNGRILPSDDYWYVVIFPDGNKVRGHFTLKR